MRTFSHHGVIESIQDRILRVRIEQSSACSGCGALKSCASADHKHKWLDVPCFDNAYTIGQKVTVIGESSLSLKAVTLSYIFPLVLMLLSLAIGSLVFFPGREGVTAVVATGVTSLYYVVLYPFRENLQARLVFTVRPYDESIPEKCMEK